MTGVGYDNLPAIETEEEYIIKQEHLDHFDSLDVNIFNESYEK